MESWMIFDGQYGSTGKGLIAGYLAVHRKPDVVVNAFAPNAGHTYIDADGRRYIHKMLPNGVVSPSLRAVLIGPGAVIDPDVFQLEILACAEELFCADLLIHEHAAVVRPDDKVAEREAGLGKIGSTLQGTMAATVRRMRRDPEQKCGIARDALRGTQLERYLVSDRTYLNVLRSAERLQIESAQGFGLSMYNGFYPYVTSRAVTPTQVLADCGVPLDVGTIQLIYSLRTYPIRVNNRDGSSGPGYEDQKEISWESINRAPELTTVTKLQRRLFTFSQQQIEHLRAACGPGDVFLNFTNYCTQQETMALINTIDVVMRPYRVEWLGTGPVVTDVIERRIIDG